MLFVRARRLALRGVGRRVVRRVHVLRAMSGRAVLESHAPRNGSAVVPAQKHALALEVHRALEERRGVFEAGSEEAAEGERVRLGERHEPDLALLGHVVLRARGLGQGEERGCEGVLQLGACGERNPVHEHGVVHHAAQVVGVREVKHQLGHCLQPVLGERWENAVRLLL